MSVEVLSDIFLVVVLIAASLIGREILVRMGQRWITTFAHTATLTTLPIITFVITKVISGNIALSLGMIGALSIVRFRNPVKSPFELSVYFAAIAMGIAASVSVKWLLFLVGAVGLAMAVLTCVSRIWGRVFDRPYFEQSFSEGNHMSTLEVQSSEVLAALQGSKHLISLSKRADGFSYILASDNFAVLQSEMDQIQNEATVLQVQLNK